MTSGDYQISILSTLPELESIADEWDRLLLSSPAVRPEMSSGWLISFFQHCLGKDQRWLVLTARLSQGLVGLLPVVVRSHPFLGSSHPLLTVPNDIQTNFVDLLAHKSVTTVVSAALLKHLDTATPGWLELRFRRLPQSSEAYRIATTPPEDYRRFVDLNGFGSFLPITGGADIWQRLSSNFRKNLSKAQRRLQQSVRLRVISGSPVQDHLAAYRTFLEIEASGWKKQSGTAIKCDAQLESFYRAVITRLAERNLVEWHFLDADETPISAHMAFRMEHRLFLSKIAYDDTYAYYSPGNQLFLMMLESLVSEGRVTEVDCLTDMEWHQNWRMQRRPYYDITIYPKRALPLLARYYPLRLLEMARKIPGARPTVRLLRRLSR